MSKVVALIYADVNIPPEIYQEVRRLRDEGRLDLLDVVEAEVKDNGKLKFEKSMSQPLVGHAEGLFLPALVGLLFFNSHQNVNDNVRKTVADIALDPRFMERLSMEALPRNSILFLHFQGDVSPQSLEQIGQHGGRILELSLTGYQEDKLQKLFHGHGWSDSQATLIHSL